MLTRTEVRAWQIDEGVNLQGWERRALLLLDEAYIAAAAEAASKSPST